MMWVEKCNNRAVGKMRVRRRDTRIWFVGLMVFLAVFLFTFLRQSFKDTDEVEAANLVNFDPGYIISDYQMGRYDSMTEEEIQVFLTAKNPCNNTSQSDYEYLTVRYPNLKWHFSDGHFVCLSEELFGDGEVIGEGETAAHIIWQAAQDYQINPQVLIVLLQKEQGLITDSYPNSRQYRAATGYGCPDTAACSEKYYGFKNQIRNAAAMFRVVLDGGWTNYPLGNNYIQYNPNAECGGSIVNVRSLATSALYRYTPYQPNEGAIAAGYGTAYCGSYGNRNFYHYFEDWFSGINDEDETIILTDENVNDELSWGVLSNMLSEAKKGLDIEQFDTKYNKQEKLSRAEVIDIFWKLFGEEKRGDGTFDDISEYSLNSQVAITWAYNKGITKYYSREGEFAPGATATRREVMIFLWRYAGEPEISDEEIEETAKTFRDFPTDELGKKAITWAYNKGITKYYSREGEFAPGATATRREVMIFLWRYAGEPEISDEEIEETAKTFRDFPTDELGKKAITWAYNKGITKYYSREGEFAPGATATRREVMIFLWRYVGEEVAGEEIFDDISELEMQRKIAIVWAYDKGITKYYSREGEFAPNVIATIREATIFISRAFSQ